MSWSPLVYLRTGLPHLALAKLYRVGRSTFSEAISEIGPMLAARSFAVPDRVDGGRVRRRRGDALALHLEWCNDAPLWRSGGSDGTTWHRPGQIWDAAREDYVRRPVAAATSVTAADLLDRFSQPGQAEVLDVIAVDPTRAHRSAGATTWPCGPAPQHHRPAAGPVRGHPHRPPNSAATSSSASRRWPSSQASAPPLPTSPAAKGTSRRPRPPAAAGRCGPGPWARTGPNSDAAPPDAAASAIATD